MDKDVLSDAQEESPNVERGRHKLRILEEARQADVIAWTPTGEAWSG